MKKLKETKKCRFCKGRTHHLINLVEGFNPDNIHEKSFKYGSAWACEKCGKVNIIFEEEK